ncbi:hypothetical protein GCM10010435_36560 [Winogradskya consettensis]
MHERVRHAKDLGELMVIAHAVVAAEAGVAVIVLIDDGPGSQIASAELMRLRRLRAQGYPVGAIALFSTLTVLKRAAGSPHIPDRNAMRDIYERLRTLDDGLPPLVKTDLLAPAHW